MSRASAKNVRAPSGMRDFPPAEYEVVVVLDGGNDDAAARVRRLEVPYALRVEAQPPLGAAAARNRGAAAARAPLLLFLDDDMEAAPQLLAAHLAAQAARPGVVLGYFTTPPAEREGLLALDARLWWAGELAERARPTHRFTFRDLWTGNVSIPRARFDEAGGFDERFAQGTAGEDWELGVRLLARDVPFSFTHAAACVHHDHPTAARSRRRLFASGRGHALMVRTNPALFRVFSFSRPVRRAVFRPAWHLIWWRPALAMRLSVPLWGVLRPLEALKLRRWWRKAHWLLLDCAYWCGVSTELRDVAEWRRLATTAPAEPPRTREVEIDVATELDGDLAPLDARLAREPADAARLRYGAVDIGRLPPVAGAERLRAVHVRAALTGRLRGRLLAAMARDAACAHAAVAAVIGAGGGVDEEEDGDEAGKGNDLAESVVGAP